MGTIFPNTREYFHDIDVIVGKEFSPPPLDSGEPLILSSQGLTLQDNIYSIA